MTFCILLYLTKCIIALIIIVTHEYAYLDMYSFFTTSTHSIYHSLPLLLCPEGRHTMALQTLRSVRMEMDAVQWLPVTPVLLFLT